MLAIIDGDIPCYSCCPPRYQSNSKHVSLDANGKLIYQDIVELDSEGKYIMPEFTEEENRRYINTAWSNFKSNHNKLLDTLWTNDYLMAVKGKNNYRDLIYPEYKQPRVKAQKVDSKYSLSKKIVPIIRDKAVEEGYAIRADGREADDFIRIWAEECRAAGKDYIICSMDKDLLCIPGKHYLMHNNLSDDKRIIEVSEADALKFYYKQVLMGDNTDNIPGVPGLGPKTADKLLSGLTEEVDFQEVVVEAYFNKYGPDEWYGYMLSNLKMIHIQKHYHDYCQDVVDWPIIKELVL